MPRNKVREYYISGKDGKKIYFETFGKNKKKNAIFISDGLGCIGFAWKYFIPYFKEKIFIIHWNYPGHGNSEIPKDLSFLSLETLCDYIAEIIDELKIKKVIHIGHSLGVQVGFEFWRRHKEKVLGLIAVAGTYEKPLNTFYDNNILKTLFPYFYEFILHFKSRFESFWRKVVPSNLVYLLATLIEVNGKLIKKEDLMSYLEHISKMDMEVFARMLYYAQQHSSLPYLENIDCPVLLFAGKDDGFTPYWLLEFAYEKIKNCELCIVKGGSHALPIEFPDLLNMRIEKFLIERKIIF